MSTKFSLSFDDCVITDVRAASLMQAYGIKGTFYFPSKQVGATPQMSLKEIKEEIIDRGHEIGGHSVSHHMDMKLIQDDKTLKFEIENNKTLIERLIMKRPITKYCYPRGRHDERVRKAVKDAGYTEARTTRVLQIQNDTGDPFQTPTTIHMFPREEYNGVHWFDLAQEYLQKALDTPDSLFSCWGHSVELNNQRDWNSFEKLLKLISSKT